MTEDNSIRDKLIDIILKVAMQHHDNISKSDEDAACDAADEILKEFPQIQLPLGPQDKDGICYYCGKMTNSLAGNPSEWCIFLCHKDDPGKVEHHHIGCVMQRLNEHESRLKLLFKLQDNLPVASQIGLASGLDLGIKIVIEYIKQLLDKIKQLEENNAVWLKSQRIFHRCRDGVKPYPRSLCSGCLDGRDFNILKELKQYEQLKELHKMQSELLYNDVAFWGSDYRDHDINKELLGIKFYIICNDVFAWGTADAEDIKDEELKFVYDIYKKYKEVGIDAWCSLKRDKLEPQEPYLEKYKDFYKIRDEIEEIMR